MNLPRFYCRPITEGKTELTGPEAHHLKAVLRLNMGQPVELFDGVGAWATANVAALKKDRVILDVSQLQSTPPRRRGRIVIAPSLAKADRFEWLISKCTELGVDRISPVRFERTVKQARGLKLMQRYQHLALAAAKQCRRLFLPQIDPPQSLSDCLLSLQQDYPQGQIILGSLSSKSKPLVNYPWSDTDISAFVGPEGGLTEKELNLLDSCGARQVRLTDTVLRVETAGVALAALLAAQRCFTHL